jgi:hypothetical protein
MDSTSSFAHPSGAIFDFSFRPGESPKSDQISHGKKSLFTFANRTFISKPPSPSQSPSLSPFVKTTRATLDAATTELGFRSISPQTLNMEPSPIGSATPLTNTQSSTSEDNWGGSSSPRATSVGSGEAGSSEDDDEAQSTASLPLKEWKKGAQMRLLRRPELEDISEIKSTPLFTEAVREYAHGMTGEDEDKPFNQYGLLAGDISGTVDHETADNRIFWNISAPSSVFICGSQGSGKSHTLSCLLENALAPCEANTLPKPLTGIVFHYDTFISDTGGSPCEAAWLSSNPDIKVRVLCPPTNIRTIKARQLRDSPRRLFANW